MLRTIILIGALVSMIGHTVAQKNVYGHFDYKTECMNIEQDGSQTVMAWGRGRNRFDAAAQAKKNALYDVIFNGIREGSGGCEIRPLVPAVNARRTYEDFFNKFFTDRGAFESYVTVQDERISQKILRNRTSTQDDVTHGFVIRVLRPELKEYLKSQAIIK